MTILKNSPEFITVKLNEFYATCSSDNIPLPPRYIFNLINFSGYVTRESQQNILHIKGSGKNQLDLFWENFASSETAFFKILKLDNVVEVTGNRDQFTTEQNERIDMICYYNRLKAAAEQGNFKIPFGYDLPALPDTFKGEKFSHVIHFLENQKTGWAFLAAAFLLANIIETHVDLSEKTDEGIKEHWNKRFHDAISCVEKAVEFDPTIKSSIDMFLLHMKIVVEEFYPDIKQRINTLFLNPDIETLKYYRRNPVQALLQYKKNLFVIKLPEKSKESNSQENNQNAMQRYCSN